MVVVVVVVVVAVAVVVVVVVEEVLDCIAVEIARTPSETVDSKQAPKARSESTS